MNERPFTHEEYEAAGVHGYSVALKSGRTREGSEVYFQEGWLQLVHQEGSQTFIPMTEVEAITIKMG